MFSPNSSNNQQDVEKWMEDTAAKRNPRKKLIFDKRSRKLIAVDANDPRVDQSLQFKPEDAQRFVRRNAPA